jgi:hypothetical protein
MTLEEAIAQKQLELTELRAAITRILTGAQEHSLDDGSGRGTIKRPDIKALFEERSRLENELAALEAQRCGIGSTHIIPGF